MFNGELINTVFGVVFLFFAFCAVIFGIDHLLDGQVRAGFAAFLAAGLSAFLSMLMAVGDRIINTDE